MARGLPTPRAALAPWKRARSTLRVLRIKRRTKARRLDCPLIFYRTSHHWGSYGRAGAPIGKAAWHQWRAAVKAAGLRKDLVPYDLRRTALRNMIRGGTNFTVAMKISGHGSRSTFDRYNIVDEHDVRAAVLAMAAHVAEQPKTHGAQASELRTMAQLRGEALKRHADKLGVAHTDRSVMMAMDDHTTTGEYGLPRRVSEAERGMRESRLWNIALVSAMSALAALVAVLR